MATLNYNVILSKILGYKRKLKIISLLKFHSYSRDKFSLLRLNYNKDYQEMNDEQLIEHKNLHVYCDDNIIADKNIVNFKYMGGYVAGCFCKNI